MKLYTCQMLDESMEDWEDCIVAVMESPEEQETYYSSDHRWKIREKMLEDSGYSKDFSENDIEFWFAYEMNGFHYAEEIAQNIAQFGVWDTDYMDFKLIEPTKEK